MKFIVKGGKSLEGEITLAGAKNAASKMMIASLLTDEQCTLSNFPQIGETEITGELCESVGSVIQRAGSIATIHTPVIKTSKISSLSRRNRMPILVIAPLLHRTGEAEVPVLGGDKIGPRPVNFHIEALKMMGAMIDQTDAGYKARAPHGLHGAEISLDFPSVMATETVLLAGVLAAGKTVLRNAATEPEIIDLIKMLQNMGAIIELGPSREIFIEGVAKLHGVQHKIIPDRNEAVSFACLAIATGGKIFIKDAIQEHLITFLNVVRRMGAEYSVLPEGIIFSSTGNLRPVVIETGTHPGFMTDWQQPVMVLLTQAGGPSELHETIWEDRLGYAEDLNALGADIQASVDCGDFPPCRFNGRGYRHRAVAYGPTQLQGGSLKVRDLRAGMAALLIALVADGTSEIEGIEEIDRGYEDIDVRLKNLGAEIKRVKD